MSSELPIINIFSSLFIVNFINLKIRFKKKEIFFKLIIV